MGLKFNSPIINLFFSIDDFIKFIERLDYYLQLELIEDKDERKKYPIGKLGDLQINFMHYNNFENAKKNGKKDVKEWIGVIGI